MTDDDKQSYGPCDSQYKGTKSHFNGINPKVTHEVFRNDTTAVEVIVKEVTGKRKINTDTSYMNTNVTIRGLYKEIELLKKKLDDAKANTDGIMESYRTITLEIKKQLDRAHQRELKEQTNNLALQLENLKLRTQLDSKTNLIKKLMKELTSVRRVVSFVAKGASSVSQSPELTINSDSECRAFEKELQNCFITNVFDADGFMFDSTISNNL